MRMRDFSLNWSISSALNLHVDEATIDEQQLNRMCTHVIACVRERVRKKMIIIVIKD